MKYVLVLLVIVFVLWWMWGRGERGSTSAKPSARGARRGDDAAPEAMVSCAHCGVHLPRSDALPAPDGALYCSAAHRLAGPPS